MSVGSNQDACNPVRTEIGDAVFLVAPSEFDWFKHCEAAKGLFESDTLVQAGGRGGARVAELNGRSFLVRPYRRGGLPGRVIKDSFIYLRERNVRGIRELKLLCYLHGCGLPVPRPILTVFRRKQLTYRCSIILDYIPDVRPLASVFEDLAEERWYELGVLLKRLHCHQVYHTDLNSFNILVGSSQFHIIDFDKCYIVPPILRRWSAWWLRRNIHRLYRSLAKVDPEAGAPPKDAWKALLRGYDSV